MIGKGGWRSWLSLSLMLVLCALPSHSLLADAFSDRRAYVGLKLFRTFVGADLALEQKLGADQKLDISLVYAANDSDARDYQQALSDSLPSVRELAVNIRLRALDDLLHGDVPPAAVFIAEKLSRAELDALVRYCTEHKVVLFSPFEGDVENGVLGGLAVEASVRPLINMATLRRSGIELKSFYLTVAKHYD
ncbi:hypothetical protein ACQUQU_01575 [Thalassolituus sp. LLYu03]|uniref:hypothetical protein n=1 Tax=Thalassolituus sp. LLYu03 TaxID=3421656 RepID=UPI003D29C009